MLNSTRAALAVLKKIDIMILALVIITFSLVIAAANYAAWKDDFKDWFRYGIPKSDLIDLILLNAIWLCYATVPIMAIIYLKP